MEIKFEILAYAFLIGLVIVFAIAYDDFRSNQFRRYCYDKHIEKGIDFEECMMRMDELYENQEE